MSEMGSGYGSPQIQRRYLIPLAEQFVRISIDSSSVDEFVEYIIQNKSTSCSRSNIKLWRKDACKALRLANTRTIVAPVPKDSPVTVDGCESSKVDADRRFPRKRSKLSLEPPAEPISPRTASCTLSNIRCTVPMDLQKQIKGFLTCHLLSDLGLPVWPTLLVNGPPFCGKTTLIEAACGTLGLKIITVSVGTVTSSMRSWMDIFNQAKVSSPCILHLDDIESMEKHSSPVGAFRLTCLLKSHLLRDMVNSGVVLIGETRCLLASLPQSILDLFTQKLTFGMLTETHRLRLLQQYLLDDTEFSASSKPVSHITDQLQLSENLTCFELARRTPGYEIGDLIRLVAQLKMACITSKLNDDEDTDDNLNNLNTNDVECAKKGMNTDFSNGSCMVDNSVSKLVVYPLIVTREIVDKALLIVVPAIKNTAEFVTIPDVTWADVGGLETTRQQLYNRFMLLIDDWERAQVLHRHSGGVLLEGPPGCGKTLVAKALSNQAGLNFLSVKGPEVLNKFQGESERRIREIFERARACQPCLIFFDEIDAICPRRDSDESTGSRVSLVNQLLVELDGIDKHRSGRVFVVGATNRKDMIDPAILRPGRLGLHLVINPPSNVEERLSVLSACTRCATTPRIENGMLSLEIIANDLRTEKMSGADLENLLELAKQKAQIARQDFVSQANLLDALSELHK
ncbi:Nuclear valosin-containing protein-like [Schistosoma japonicum]|uniref:Nuclear valosin-containing protein-like n=3 Tax=Schistosoma japonicum TaxID=6182 RepID=A0A4Z2DDD4_SCHJA|nr:Nuclear valosin-containing protein-like [Schistosoma japonicum]TNN14470.1 Nuclear valosin-containing protein-like [Schistosoma japonicum]